MSEIVLEAREGLLVSPLTGDLTRYVGGSVFESWLCVS